MAITLKKSFLKPYILLFFWSVLWCCSSNLLQDVPVVCSHTNLKCFIVQLDSFYLISCIISNKLCFDYTNVLVFFLTRYMVLPFSGIPLVLFLIRSTFASWRMNTVLPGITEIFREGMRIFSIEYVPPTFLFKN